MGPFSAHRQFTFRVIALHAPDSGIGPRPWIDDDATKKLVLQVLTKDEMKQFLETSLGLPGFVQAALETRFLEEMRRVMFGKVESADAMETARQIRLATPSL